MTFHPQSASAQLTNSIVVNSKILTPVARTENILGLGALNTHFFDGRMSDMIVYLQEDITRAAQISKDEKTKAFGDLAQCIKNCDSPFKSQNSLVCFDTIVCSHSFYGRLTAPINRNYDSANNLHACDLLYLLYEKICIDDDTEYLTLLLTQLDEMVTGLCPQGRTTRLFQTLVMLKDNLPSKPVEST
uniref:Uncharacterized protein n=1 Tax=Marseillevirus LCMAC102 TaxID=2506603 RepID=A0A481YUR3_9VIRU|nr:MAG: uncharacterized protein LCMAC102_00690 [Marseillevirus LCMAC102]